MNMFDRGIPLNDDDCIDFKNDTIVRVEKLKSVINNLDSTIRVFLENQNIRIPDKKYDPDIREKIVLNLLQNGVPCELLKINSSGWQKGELKIRVSVEFYPDEPEIIEEPPSPLDDIRKSMG